MDTPKYLYAIDNPNSRIDALLIPITEYTEKERAQDLENGRDWSVDPYYQTARWSNESYDDMIESMIYRKNTTEEYVAVIDASGIALRSEDWAKKILEIKQRFGESKYQLKQSIEAPGLKELDNLGLQKIITAYWRYKEIGKTAGGIVDHIFAAAEEGNRDKAQDYFDAWAAELHDENYAQFLRTAEEDWDYESPTYVLMDLYS